MLHFLLVDDEFLAIRENLSSIFSSIEAEECSESSSLVDPNDSFFSNYPQIAQNKIFRLFQETGTNKPTTYSTVKYHHDNEFVANILLTYKSF